MVYVTGPTEAEVLSATKAVNVTVPVEAGVPVMFNVEPLLEAISVPLAKLTEPLPTLEPFTVHVYPGTPPVAAMDPV
jgi:hypothetical protein